MVSLKNIIYILVFGLICGTIGYLFGLHRDGATVDEVRGQLEDSQASQRTITDGLGTATSQVKDAGRIIDECNYIIQRIRQQPAKEN